MYLSLTLYGKQQNFSRTKRRKKSRFRELSTDGTTEKKKAEKAVLAATKQPQAWV